MTKLKIGVFGCGNMGRALVLGMHARHPNTEFFLYTPSGVKAQALATDVKGFALSRCEEMPINCDWYMLGFKPQVLDTFHYEFKSDSKIISILAGVQTQKLIEKFKTSKVARLMPNTPSALGEGANLVFFNSFFNSDEEEKFNSLFSATGKLFKMNTEADLDLTTAFSGSGPALVFELARIFEVELSRMTEGRVPAKEIISQTFFGSSSLMKGVHSFEELREQVTSKKGVTYEALEVLKENNLQEIFSKAFMAAYNRTLELSK
jgi:pyrroline-5-carboxylate reductase